MRVHTWPSSVPRPLLNSIGLALAATAALAGANACVGADRGKSSADHQVAADANPPSPPSEEADGQLPPVECPLRRAGVNPHDLKPFGEVEKYIEFLERADRQRWQKPDEVVAALGLKGDETVVDLGAGSGYFTFRFAKALPQGKVVAVDTEPEMIRHIHFKAMAEGISNVEPRIAEPRDPKLPAGADVVFICDVLHHIQRRSQWLKKLHSQMPSGARLVLVEFKSGDLPEGPPEAIKVPKDKLIAVVKEVGFNLQQDKPELLPYQEFLVFVKP